MSFSRRATTLLRSTRSISPTIHTQHTRFFTTSRSLRAQPTPPSSSRPSPHGLFYKTHGRALAKSLTLAFLSYQFFYWFWLTIEAETMRDEKTGIIKELESEARLLADGMGSHTLDGARLLEEKEGKDG